MAIVFDGSERLISLTTETTLSVPYLYSRWKDFMKISDNAKFAPAFSPVGGDPIDQDAGTEIPLYAFLTNGWRIRPQEANHTLTVTSGILLVSGGGDPFVDTLSPWTVRINYQQPVQAITVGTSGVAGATAQAVWEYPIPPTPVSGSFGEWVNRFLLTVGKFIALK